MTPKVSVVVPNYNHARFLGRRLDSIIAQTFQDFEIVYLDDASTDSSADVFAAYADNPRVRAFLSTQNSGTPFVQWNRGVREARGEYVWIAEADDDADPRLLHTLVSLLDAHPNVGMAYCQSLLVGPQDETLGSCADWGAQLDPAHWTQDFVRSGRDECREFLAQACTIYNASAVVFRKSIYVDAGGADEHLRMCADWKLWVNIMLRSDVAFCALPLNHFRQHPASVSRRAAKDGTYAEEACRVVRSIQERVDVPPAVRERAAQELASRWISVLLSLPLARNRAIWHALRRADPHWARHVARQAAAHTVRRLRGQTPF